MWLAAWSDSETPPILPSKPTSLKGGKTNSPSSVPPAFYNSTPTNLPPSPVTHSAPLHAFCQRIPVVGGQGRPDDRGGLYGRDGQGVEVVGVTMMARMTGVAKVVGAAGLASMAGVAKVAGVTGQARVTW
jgi:hypothetical protein